MNGGNDAAPFFQGIKDLNNSLNGEETKKELSTLLELLKKDDVQQALSTLSNGAKALAAAPDLITATSFDEYEKALGLTDVDQTLKQRYIDLFAVAGISQEKASDQELVNQITNNIIKSLEKPQPSGMPASGEKAEENSKPGAAASDTSAADSTAEAAQEPSTSVAPVTTTSAASSESVASSASASEVSGTAAETFDSASSTVSDEAQKKAVDDSAASVAAQSADSAAEQSASQAQSAASAADSAKSAATDAAAAASSASASYSQAESAYSPMVSKLVSAMNLPGLNGHIADVNGAVGTARSVAGS